jgi:predicted RNase H-like HicB family nuclease
MNNYEIVVYWSTEDNAFIAEVPELAGCMADGQTYIEAVQNAEIAINEWIETARLMERTIPVARGKLVYV